MRFEEEFEIEIPDEATSTLITPRNVIDYLISKLEIRNKGWSRDFVAQKVWLIIEDECGVNIKKYNEDSRFVDEMGLD